MKHHVIISGTGRAGTTFLVQLFTALGLDTGFRESVIDSHCHAGMELDLRQADAPYIVKSPWLCDYLEDVLEGGGVVIDHAIVPVRELFAAAESRRSVSRRAGPGVPADHVPGGLWHTTRPEEQESILAQELYKLLIALAEHDIPMTLLQFPRLATDGDYLYRKLGFLLKGLPRDAFWQVFRGVSQPGLIHDFSSPRVGAIS